MTDPRTTVEAQPGRTLAATVRAETALKERHTGWRAWLLDETPASRHQARLGQAYLILLRLHDNALAAAGLALVVVLVVCALVTPLLVTQDPLAQDLAQRLLPPGAGHWFGTDELGRDMFARVIYGSRVTLLIVVLVAIIAAPVGLLIGCVAGTLRGGVDTVIMRITDIFLAFPRLILALALVAALGPGIENAVIAIALTAWPVYARVARAEALVVRDSDYVNASRLQGASNWWLIRHQVMPMCVNSTIVRVTLDMAGIILTAAGLGFLGLGAQPPTPEWGAMIAAGRAYFFDQWWLATIPGVAILLVSLGFNLLGDGLRDVLDPRL